MAKIEQLLAYNPKKKIDAIPLNSTTQVLLVVKFMAMERQHYVPQFFLKGFADPVHPSGKMIWVYDKRFDNPPKQVSVKSVAWSSFYYSQDKENGEEDTDTLERSFAEKLENQVPNIIQSIKAKPGEKFSMEDEHIGILAYFLGLLFTRVPSFRDGINNLYTKIAQVSLELAARHEPFIAENLKKYGVKVTAKEWISLEPMLRVANRISESCLNKEWQFFVPHKDEKFITSDNPVHFSIPHSAGKLIAGPAHPAAEIIVNLRSDLALVCTPPRRGMIISGVCQERKAV